VLSCDRLELRDSTEHRDVISLDFEIIGLCQYPVYDIKAVEPLDIHISDDSLPTVFLRSDFPPVPHLNIHSDNRVKSMCYSELPFNELCHKMNGRFLIIFIFYWTLFINKASLKRAADTYATRLFEACMQMYYPKSSNKAIKM